MNAIFRGFSWAQAGVSASHHPLPSSADIVTNQHLQRRADNDGLLGKVMQHQRRLPVVLPAVGCSECLRQTDQSI